MLTPSTDSSILDWYREKWIKAIIIEGFGDWNVPSYPEVSCTDNESRDLHKQQYMRAKLFHERIKRCIDAGIIVVLWSQCHTWVVDHKYTWGQQMLWWWALSADQHTLPAIRWKLAYLLKHSDNIPRDFTKNISGELL
jgi:L-asparaginase/Glu-tRNA(Gln) amidotransferase subunit D